jgi:hypothetical protein
MAKLVLFKKDSCPYCIKFKEPQNFGALKHKLSVDTETTGIQVYEYESKKDITDIKKEVNLARISGKINGVPTLCLFNGGENWEIIDIEVWLDKNNNKRDVEKIFDRIKQTLIKFKNLSPSKTDNFQQNVFSLSELSNKKKYIKYKIKYLELKNKYLQQK